MPLNLIDEFAPMAVVVVGALFIVSPNVNIENRIMMVGITLFLLTLQTFE